jgi:hypothetical protein
MTPSEGGKEQAPSRARIAAARSPSSVGPLAAQHLVMLRLDGPAIGGGARLQRVDDLVIHVADEKLPHLGDAMPSLARM